MQIRELYEPPPPGRNFISIFIEVGLVLFFSRFVLNIPLGFFFVYVHSVYVVSAWPRLKVFTTAVLLLSNACTRSPIVRQQRVGVSK